MGQKMAILILIANLKGGVGKSTISSILASKFNIKGNKKTCVFNIDKGQSAETINEVETIDYSSILETDDTIKVSDAIAAMLPEYDYIFIDTAGDLSTELIEIINYIDYFVVPFDRGKRTFEDTITYLNSIFASGIIEDKKEHGITLVFNKYNNKSDIEEVNSKYRDALINIATENKLDFDLNFTKLSQSDVVETMEELKASADTLVGRNAVAYRIFDSKAEDMYLSVKEHLEKTLKLDRN